jgi:hypothetical protein
MHPIFSIINIQTMRKKLFYPICGIILSMVGIISGPLLMRKSTLPIWGFYTALGILLIARTQKLKDEKLPMIQCVIYAIFLLALASIPFLNYYYSFM